MKEGVGKTGEEITRSRRVERKDRGGNLVILLYFSTPILLQSLGNLKTMFILPAWHHTRGHSSLANVYLKRGCTKRSRNVTCI
jgi:hypothetical protein